MSKKLSWLLRHGAEQEGLKLGPGGYVNLGDAVSGFFPIVFLCVIGQVCKDLEGDDCLDLPVSVRSTFRQTL